METVTILMMVGMGLVVLSALLMTACQIWYLVEMFRESIWWGLGGLFCGGIVGLIFLFAKWSKAWPPVAASLLCFPPMLIGFLVMYVESATGV